MSRNKRQPLLPGQLRIILALALICICGWVGYYSQTPTGQFLTDSEKEILYTVPILQPAEYDALYADNPTTLYHLTVRLLGFLITGEAGLIILARVLNIFALVMAAGFSAATAGFYWKKDGALWFAGFLIGLNPVLLFWSADISPVLLSVACAACAVWNLGHWMRNPTISSNLALGLSLTLGVAYQPMLLPFCLLWPVFSLIYSKKNRWLQGLAAAGFPLLLLVILNTTVLSLPGEFSMDKENIGQSLYMFFNNMEQSEGKTYGLYKQLHVFLYLNPIGWGSLLILSAIGLYTRHKDKQMGPRTYTLVLIFACGLISSLAFDPVSKARLVMLPILAIMASGLLSNIKIWQKGSKKTKYTILVICFATGTLTYSNFFDIRGQQSFEDDYLFLTQANLQQNNEAGVVVWATKGLEAFPDNDAFHVAMIELTLQQWAFGTTPKPIHYELAEEYMQRTERLSKPSPYSESIRALYLYKMRKNESAIEIWKQHMDTNALAYMALFWTLNAEKITTEELQRYLGDKYYALLVEVYKVDRSRKSFTKTEKMMDNLFAYAH